MLTVYYAPITNDILQEMNMQRIKLDALIAQRIPMKEIADKCKISPAMVALCRNQLKNEGRDYRVEMHDPDNWVMVERMNPWREVKGQKQSPGNRTRNY
jgi:hypothetical protein